MMIKPVSSACNMRCTYCFYADEAKNREVSNYGIMTDETLETIVRRAFAYGDHSVSIVFQGGEPTLAGATFYQKLLHLERKYNTRGLSVSHALQTNGYWLEDDLLQVLKEGNFLLGVSLDGTQKIHDSRRIDGDGNGTYDRVMQNIQRLQKAKLPYNILCVVDNEIARNGTACYQSLKTHGYVQFVPCLEPFGHQNTVLDPQRYGQFLIEVFHLYADDFEKHHYISVRNFDNWLQMLLGFQPELCAMKGHCSANLLVESNGDVFPCDFYALDKWKMGNVLQTNFGRLLKTDIAQHFVASSLGADENCVACAWHWICRGGCRRDRESLTRGGALQANRLCKSYQMFFESCAERLKHLATLPMPETPSQS